MVTQLFKNLLDNCFNNIVEISESNIIYKLNGERIVINYGYHGLTDTKMFSIYCSSFGFEKVSDLNRIEFAVYLTKFEGIREEFKNKEINTFVELSSKKSNEEF